MASSDITTNRDDVERWADEHDAVPVREGNRIKLVPEDEVSPNQERLDWETFHREIDENEQVVVLHGDRSGRDRFEVADRSSALERVEVEHDREDVESRLLEGETVTGTITETTVVTETIVEEATLESEVIDREIVDRRVTNLELLDRTCQSCEATGDAEDVAYGDRYDTDRFLLDDTDVTTGELEQYDGFPYDVSVDVDETWSVTIDERERYTVETRITDVDVTEMDTVDSHEVETHVDLDAVHDQLLQTIDIEREDESEVVNADTYDIDSEFVDDDRITTTLLSRRTIEKEIAEQWRLTTEVVEGELRSRKTERESVRESGLVERSDESGTAEGTAVTETDAVREVPQDDDVGKPVVVSAGERIGMVTDVEDGIAYVDPHPGITEKISAKLGWSDRDEEDFPLEADRIDAITHDEVQLSGDYDEAELEKLRQHT